MAIFDKEAAAQHPYGGQLINHGYINGIIEIHIRAKTLRLDIIKWLLTCG